MASDAIISSTFRDDAAGREHSRFESALVMRLNQALADDRAGRTIPHAKVRQQMRSALKKRIAKRG